MFGKAVVFFAAINAGLAAILNAHLKNVAMPEECDGKNFCFYKSDRYPQKQIDNIINATLPRMVEVGDQMEHRGGGEKPEDDCQRDPRLEPIYEIIDKDGNVRFVAQSDGNFLQKIRTETCLNPGRITSSLYFEDFELDEYNFTCEEHRIEYSFLTLSLDGTRLEDVDIKDGLPVCCSCRINKH